MTRVWRLLLLISLFAVPLGAYPFSNCGKRPLTDFRNLLHRTAVIGGSDERMTYRQYADMVGKSESDIKKLLSGTGVIKCDKGGGSAQVTQSQSVVTTAGHIFFDENCNPKQTKCRILLYGDKGVEGFDLDLSTLKTGDCQKSEDWAVLKTTRPLPKRFNAYKVDPNDKTLQSSDQITVVAGFSNTFQVNGKYPPNVANCSSGGRSINGDVLLDCDTGKGTSGSAVFRRDKVGQYMSAIVSGELYSGDANTAIQIEGEFLKAILDASGS